MSNPVLAELPGYVKPTLVLHLPHARTRAGEHPLCTRLCDGCYRQEVSKHFCQSIREQVRVGQPQAACGAFKAF